MNYKDNVKAEVRGHFQLIRAYIQSKATLNYQISQLKIKKNYHQSNNDYRDYKEMLNVSKIIGKRHSELKGLKNKLKTLLVKSIKPESIQKLFGVIYNSEIHIKDIEEILYQNSGTEKNIIALKEKLNILKERHAEQLKVQEENQVAIHLNISNQALAQKLEVEISDYKKEVLIYNQQIRVLKKTKKISHINRKANFDRIKIYKTIPENALKLRSKWLLRDELQKALINAEIEIEILEEKVNDDKRQLKELEESSEENTKISAKYEIDLFEMNKYIKKIEAKIQLLKDELTNNNITVIATSPKSANYRIAFTSCLDEGETCCISRANSGFIEMQKESESLIKENNILKEKIAKLFHGKAH